MPLASSRQEQVPHERAAEMFVQSDAKPRWLPAQSAAAVPASRVRLLLSTYNGAAYLHEQLDSLLTQTHKDWMLHWRDDGSTDATVPIMEAFARTVGPDRCIRVTEPRGHLGPASSFVALLQFVVMGLGPQELVAFVDQDDVWLPDKLSRGVAALARCDAGTPGLYCARLLIVDSHLRRIGKTTITSRNCGFPASLTQNIATGCTVMLNRQASTLIARSALPAESPHDWWCYLVVTGAGGQVEVDDVPVALYRQHGRNVVGASGSPIRRAVSALQRGRRAYMATFRQHVSALAEQPEVLSSQARANLARLKWALEGNALRRLAALRLPGLHRQKRIETMLFRLWFIIG